MGTVGTMAGFCETGKSVPLSGKSRERNSGRRREAIVSDRSWHVQMEGPLLAYEWPTCTETLSGRDIYESVRRARCATSALYADKIL